MVARGVHTAYRLSARAATVREVSTALYRRYRPETFADVIAQEHVTEPLMQALRTGRVNHAYLFSGPRGCGKTTSARILARCLNCEQGPTATPCGECESCRALARGGSGTVDVIEIDAASHGGVDDARDLREKASYGPAQSRYKVYIIDEAHMVTPQGFNALLKIVEEPPEHVKFIFATTEPEKVIGTIRSRTHHYPFRLVPPQRLTDYMESLCAQEGVTVAPGVLSFVVRAGGGSVRDSLSVLDQLIAGSGPEGLTYESAAALLGFTDGELLDETIDALGAGDGAGAFRAIEKVVETGLDPRRFVEDLLERLRDLIVVAAVPDGAGAVLRALPPDQLERMRSQAAAFGSGALSRAADIVNAGLTEMSGATAPRLQLELIAARVLLPAAAGEAGYAARLDRLERRLDVGGVPSAGGSSRPAPPAPATAPAQSSPPQATRQPEPVRQPEPRGAVRPERPVEPARQQEEQAAGSPAGPAVPPAGAAGASVSASATPTTSTTSTTAETAASDEDAAPGGTPRPDPERQRAEAHDHAEQHGEFALPPEGPPAPVDDAPAGPTSVAPTPGSLDIAAIRRSWPDVLGKVFSLRRTTWTFLSSHAQPQSFDGRVLVLGIATEGLTQTFRRGSHADWVRQALIDVLGVDARVEGVPTDGIAIDRGGAPDDEPAPIPPPESGGYQGGGHQGGSHQGGSHQSGGDPGRGTQGMGGSAGTSAPGGYPPAGGSAHDHGAGPAAARPSWGEAPAPADSAPSWASGPQATSPEPAYATSGAAPSGSEPSGTEPSGGAPAAAAPQFVAPDPPISPLERARRAVAAEPDPGPQAVHVADDSAISDDDESVDELGDVGVPVVERILGGTVISRDQP